MNDQELARIIDKASKQAIGADDLTSDQREAAYEFFYGEAKGQLAPPEVEGRSRVVSKDLMDTVEWAMPALMDIFAAQDDIVRFEPDSPEDEQACQDATNYIGWLIHRKNNDGFVTIHDAIKSALICRSGFGKCYVEESQDYREERYTGLLMEQVEALAQDPEIEIKQVIEAGVAQGPQGEPVPLYDVQAGRTEMVKQFRNEGVPPEELRIAKSTRVIDDCDFIEHRREVTLSYLREQGYDEAKIAQLASDESFQQDNDARHEYDDSDPDGQEALDDSQRLVMLSEAYLKVDFDGDGRTEYRRVVKVKDVVFENEVVDDHPFWLMTPILMPYKVLGLGFYDLVEDLMKIKTALTRQVLDNVYLTNHPMKEVVDASIIDMDEVLTPRIGGVIRVKASGAVREVVTPNVSEAGLALIQQFDGIRDTRTGVTEMNSAIQAESLAQSNVGSQGVQAMMNAGAQRLKLIARVLAETGFRRMYYLMLKNITQHQDKAQQVKINGRWLAVNPREWKNRYDMTVSVGTGTFGRQQQIMYLQQVAQMQQGLMQFGLATPQHVYNVAKRAIEAMGYRDADQFIAPPGSSQPPPNPKAQEMQAKMQHEAELEKLKQQFAAQSKQAELQYKAQADEMERRQKAELELIRQRAQQETDQNRQIVEADKHRMTLKHTAQLEAVKAQYAEAREMREMEFQRWKAELDAAVKVQSSQLMARNPVENIATATAAEEIGREVQP